MLLYTHRQAAGRHRNGEGREKRRIRNKKHIMRIPIIMRSVIFKCSISASCWYVCLFAASVPELGSVRYRASPSFSWVLFLAHTFPSLFPSDFMLPLPTSQHNHAFSRDGFLPRPRRRDGGFSLSLLLFCWRNSWKVTFSRLTHKNKADRRPKLLLCVVVGWSYVGML
jgi:hypothetical protein